MVGRTKKTTIAREQLDDGIELLIAGRYISALTLLGAAEEVLARLVEERTGSHPLDEWWKGLNEDVRARGYQDVAKVRFYKFFNEPRNQVKHHTPGSDPDVALYKQPAAALMAQRAITAADALGLKFRNRARCMAWFHNNDYFQNSNAKVSPSSEA